MNESSFKCSACDSHEVKPLLTYSRFPSFLFPMPRTESQAVQRRDLHLNLCQSCGHLYQSDVDVDLLDVIYGEYYACYPYDDNEAMTQVYRRPFDLFSKLMMSTRPVGKPPRLLEIGCSSPSNLFPFAEHGYECVGVDPSPLAEEKVRHERIDIVSGYYEQTQLDGRFDIIISRFNLEHIVNLEKHLEKIDNDIADSGIVIVQVPNVSYYLENQQPLFIAHEHVHYFSELSLVSLFSRFGFSPISFYSDRQPSLLACFEKKGPHVRLESESIVGRMPGYIRNIADKKEDLLRHLEGKGRILFYGCGMALFWVLLSLEGRIDARIEIVDDNDLLAGRYLPAFGHLVKSPTPDLIAQADIVVLTLNPVYHDKVVEKIKSYESRPKLLRIGAEEIERVELG